jgi:hypothetical protein
MGNTVYSTSRDIEKLAQEDQFSDEHNVNFIKSNIPKIFVINDEDYDQYFKWLETIPNGQLQAIIKKAQDRNIPSLEMRKLFFQTENEYYNYASKYVDKLVEKEQLVNNTSSIKSGNNADYTNELLYQKIAGMTSELEHEKNQVCELKKKLLRRETKLKEAHNKIFDQNDYIQNRNTLVSSLKQNIIELNQLQNRLAVDASTEIEHRDNLLKIFYRYSNNQPTIPEKLVKLIDIPHDIQQINEMKKCDMTNEQIIQVPNEIFQNISFSRITEHVIGAFGSLHNVLKLPISKISFGKDGIPNFVDRNSLTDNISIAISSNNTLCIIFKGSFEPKITGRFCKETRTTSVVLYQKYNNDNKWATIAGLDIAGSNFPWKDVFNRSGVQYDKIKNLVDICWADDVDGFGATGKFILG